MPRATTVEPDQQHNLLTEKENEFIQHMIPIFREKIQQNINALKMELGPDPEGQGFSPNWIRMYRETIRNFEEQLQKAEALYLKLQGADEEG